MNSTPFDARSIGTITAAKKNALVEYEIFPVKFNVKPVIINVVIKTDNPLFKYLIAVCINGLLQRENYFSK